MAHHRAISYHRIVYIVQRGSLWTIDLYPYDRPQRVYGRFGPHGHFTLSGKERCTMTTGLREWVTVPYRRKWQVQYRGMVISTHTDEETARRIADELEQRTMPREKTIENPITDVTVGGDTLDLVQPDDDVVDFLDAGIVPETTTMEAVSYKPLTIVGYRVMPDTGNGPWHMWDAEVDGESTQVMAGGQMVMPAVERFFEKHPGKRLRCSIVKRHNDRTGRDFWQLIDARELPMYVKGENEDQLNQIR